MTHTHETKRKIYIFFFSHLFCILNESRKSCSHVNNTLGKSVKKQINTESVVFTKVWKIAQKISLERHITYIRIFFSCEVTSYNNNSWLQQIVKRKIKYFFLLVWKMGSLKFKMGLPTNFCCFEYECYFWSFNMKN